MQKNETGPLSYMIQKNQLQMDWWHECRTWNHKTMRKKSQGISSLTSILTMIFFEFDNKSKGGNSKSKQVGLHKTKNLLYSKGNHQENETVVKENTCKSYVWKEVNIQSIQRTHTIQWKKIQLKKWTEDLNRHFSKMTTNDQQVHEKVPNITSHKEMQIKTTMRYYLTPIRIPSIQKTGNNKWWHKFGKEGIFFCIVGGNVNCFSHCGKQYKGASKN